MVLVIFPHCKFFVDDDALSMAYAYGLRVHGLTTGTDRQWHVLFPAKAAEVRPCETAVAAWAPRGGGG